eukprot:3939537-Rhodomonas_salina.4
MKANGLMQQGGRLDTISHDVVLVSVFLLWWVLGPSPSEQTASLRSIAIYGDVYAAMQTG